MSNKTAERLREAIDLLMRAFKIAEGCATVNGEEVQINAPDVQTLLFVRSHPDCRASDAANHLAVAPTTASSIIDRLVRRGLLLRQRTEENRRVVKLRLTEQGAVLGKRIVRHQLGNCSSMLATLNPKEREAFVRLISKVASTVSNSRGRG
jgi:DNA-binding MarR family transcriptional regulator